MNHDNIMLFNTILLYVINYTSDFEGIITGSGIKLKFDNPRLALEIYEHYLGEDYDCWMHSSNNVEVNFEF